MNTPTTTSMSPDDFAHLQKMVKWVENGSTSRRVIDTFAEFFRERGIPVDGRVPDGQSILSFALGSKCESLALALLEEPALAPRLARTGLLEKCLWSMRLIQGLLDRGYPAREELQTDQNIMPNILMNGSDKAISLLAKNGMPLDTFHITSTDQFKLPYSTLLYAADHSNMDNVLALLKAGSAPGVCDRNGDTFLHKVLKNRSDKTLAWVDTNCIDRLQKILNFCTQKGISLDAANLDGQTALHVAAKRGYGNSVLALLESGADSCIKDTLGHTPADLAKRKKHVEIERTLTVHQAHKRIHDLLKANGLDKSAPSPAPAGA